MDAATKRRFKNELFGHFSGIGKALAHPVRLEILELLAQGERTVEALGTEMGLPIANISQHLKVMKGANLVEFRRQGLYAHYRLCGEDVFRLWRALRGLGEARLAEVAKVTRTYLGNREDLEAIGARELHRRLKSGEVIALDVRPVEEFDAGHLPGAVSIPLAELKRRLEEIPKGQAVVAYCRGPYCVFADEAAAFLRKKGYQALRFIEGLPDWRAQGLPVETAMGGLP